MIERVTSQTQMRAAQRNLQENMSQLARLQENASSLKAINRASDNPVAAAAAFQVRAEISAVAQYQQNADNGEGWLTTADSTLSTVSSLMNRARDLTVQGANDGSLSATAKEAIAWELVGIREEMLNLSNVEYLGRNVFAGSSDEGVAFRAIPGNPTTPEIPFTYEFTGAGLDPVERRTSASSLVRVDANGGSTFGTDDETDISVFTLLDNIVANLRSGEPVNGQLTAIDDRLTNILATRTAVGARQNELVRAQESLAQQSMTLEAERSNVEDLDLGQAILDLKLQEVTYQASLAVTARVLQPTLMDFLR